MPRTRRGGKRIVALLPDTIAQGSGHAWAFMGGGPNAAMFAPIDRGYRWRRRASMARLM